MSIVGDDNDWVLIKRPGSKEHHFNSFVKEKILPCVEKAINSAVLDSFHEVIYDPASFELDIGQMILEDLKIPVLKDEDIDVENNNVNIIVRNCSAAIKEFPWSYTSRLLEDKGKARVVFKKVTFFIGLSVSVDKLFFLHLKLLDFRMEIEDLDITFSDSRRGYIYELLLRLFSTKISKLISQTTSNSVCVYFNEEISVPWMKAITMK